MNKTLQDPLFNLAALPVRDLDRQLARQLLHYETRLHTNASAEQLEALQLAGLMVSVALGKGQVCLPLSQCWVSDLQEPWHGIGPQRLHSLLAGCATVYVAGRDSAYAQQPLVLAGQRLYLARYYFYEQDVLAQLEQRLASPLQVDDSALAEVLNALFPTLPAGQTDWQKVAAATACLQRFTVITGGPGTGKTTTVTRLLSALLSTQPELSIALAAPTGKAAARMTESIRNAKLKGALPYAEQIPDDSFTLHRLLGWTPNGFRYNAQRHLPFDCVVVDEASMVDLPMMHHLLMALAPHTRLILLGDRDQLASVEAGSVLADLCDAGVEHGPDTAFAARLSALTGYSLQQVAEVACSPMQNALAQLRVSHRFDASSGIGQLAAAVNTSDTAAAQQAFRTFAQQIHFTELGQQGTPPYWNNNDWQQNVRAGLQDFCHAVTAQRPATEVFDAFGQYRLLVALRNGQSGVEEVNRQVEQLLVKQGLLPGRTEKGLWYAGRPVMISRNDYDLGLFNGDVGITLWHTDGSKPQLKVAFPDSDGGIRWLLPSRLPAHETAFAMTVHKSQGSEFTRVCLLLPEQWQNVITRELIYTAITRAREQFDVFSSSDSWERGVRARVQRASGLREALWPQAANEFEELL